MGQQQLLLIVLSTIIVGISIAVGINMVTSSAGQANFDAVMQDGITLGERARAWYRKPVIQGGGGNSFAAIADSSDMTALLGWPNVNENGTFTVETAGDADSVHFEATGVEDLDGNGADLNIIFHVGSDGITTEVVER